jgi:hypothetical protein
VCRKDGSVHFECWNGTGWAYNDKVIMWWKFIEKPKEFTKRQTDNMTAADEALPFVKDSLFANTGKEIVLAKGNCIAVYMASIYSFMFGSEETGVVTLKDGHRLSKIGGSIFLKDILDERLRKTWTVVNIEDTPNGQQLKIVSAKINIKGMNLSEGF